MVFLPMLCHQHNTVLNTIFLKALDLPTDEGVSAVSTYISPGPLYTLSVCDFRGSERVRPSSHSPGPSGVTLYTTSPDGSNIAMIPPLTP